MAEGPSELRERIVQAAARLLTEGGREAVSTRGVSAAAGVQAPAIYRQFVDMRGLQLAAARAVLANYVREKTRGARGGDPVLELSRGWDLHVAFGLANPAAYALLYADPAISDVAESREGQAHLTALVTRVAEVGWLGVSVSVAAKMIHAGGCGVTLTLIATPPEARDPKLSGLMRDTVLGAILAGGKAENAERGGTIPARAVGLRAVLKEAAGVLSPAEATLMGEWLDRMAEGGVGETREKRRGGGRKSRSGRNAE